MREELYLNKTKIDIKKGQITRKIQIADVSQVGSKKSSFSYTVKLAKTSKNIAFFDMLGILGNQSEKPFEAISADYYIDGLPIVFNGKAIVKKTTKYYLINLIDGIISLADLLEDKKINELPLDDLNHMLTTDNYIASQSNEAGFIYCMANYGQGVSQTDIELTKQAPSIFIHTLFKRIFESNGLTLQDDFFETNTKLLNEVTPSSIGYDIVAGSVVSNPLGNATTNNLNAALNTEKFIKNVTKFTISNIDLAIASIVEGNIVFNGGGTFGIQLTTNYSTVDTYANIEVLINDEQSAIINLPIGTSQVDFTEIVKTITTNDVLKLNLIVYSSLENLNGVDYAADIDIYCTSYTGGTFVQPSEYLGDVTQLNFIKDISNRFGLILHPITETSNFRFEQLETVLNDFENAEDWSSKLSSVNNEDYSSGFAKKNKAVFTYAESITTTPRDGEMLIDNENADIKKEMFSSFYEIPARYAQAIQGEIIYSTLVWEVDASLVVSNIESNIQVLNITKQNLTNPLTVEAFGGSSAQNVQNDVPFLDLTNITLQYSIENYYLAFQRLVNNYRKKEFLINLNSINIKYLDFFRLKYLKQLQRYYYLDTVVYKAGKLSKVTMFELIK